MQQIPWSELSTTPTVPAARWVVFRIPDSAAGWQGGPWAEVHTTRPALSRADEISVNARQNANMTLARAVPFQCLQKALMKACRLLWPEARLCGVLGHVDLHRYCFESCHGDHPCDALVGRLMVLAWLFGPPPDIIAQCD